MSTPFYLCARCNLSLNENMDHDCIRGITENINALHRKIDFLLEHLRRECKHKWRTVKWDAGYSTVECNKCGESK